MLREEDAEGREESRTRGSGRDSRGAVNVRMTLPRAANVEVFDCYKISAKKTFQEEEEASE